MTRTEAMPRGEARILKLLARRARAMKERGEMGVIKDVPGLMAYAFLDVEPHVTAETARIYRQALVRWLNANRSEESLLALDIVDPEPNENTPWREQEIENLRNANLQRARGSQQRATSLTEMQWILLLQAIVLSENRWARLAHRWLVAGLATGLSPHEWRRAVWNAPILIVPSAQGTKRIDFSHADPEEVASVKELVGALKGLNDDAYRNTYDGVRNVIRRVAQAHLADIEGVPSLYTARHAFTGLSKDADRAAFMDVVLGSASLEGEWRAFAMAPGMRRNSPPPPVGLSPSASALAQRAADARRFVDAASEEDS